MKARHFCAVIGVAIATGAVVFMQSLVATNAHQSTAMAERLLKTVPITEDSSVAMLALDYRPAGRVMQGPPLRVCAAAGGLAGAEIVKDGECVVSKALFMQRRLDAPPVGSVLTLVGKNGAYRLRVAGVIDWERPVRGYPNLFVNARTAGMIGEQWTKWKPMSVAELAPGFQSDDERSFDRAKALLLWAAALTALCLLVNSLFISIEARRREIAILRMLGMTRFGVMRMVAAESLALTAVGFVVGALVSVGALAGYVAAESETFPSGMAVSVRGMVWCAAVAAVVSVIAALIALKPALSVKPLEAASSRFPRKRHLGMTLAFAFGFGAFVAVEVWGASLMSAFVPSAEWPDAIVSMLPSGVSSFDIFKLRGKIDGVKRIHELAPLQVNFDAEKGNALLMGSDWLPGFRFVGGDRDTATAAINAGDNCIITEMMARAHKYKLGDELRLDCGRGLKVALKIVGIVDLNWHLVTSRALVRGLNRMPINTDGPVFVSFDTVEACDARPSAVVKMTHLWLDYEPEFLREHGVFEAGRIVEKRIVEALGLPETDVCGNTVRLHSRDEVADGTIAHGAEIIGAMARVPFIFIAVISLGFVAMLVASADSRRRELAVLCAVGATRGQIAAELARDAVKVAAVGIVFGLLGGALCGWLFTGGTRAAMANWGIPPNFVVPWRPILHGAIGAVLFALAVVIPTSYHLISRQRMRGCGC